MTDNEELFSFTTPDDGRAVPGDLADLYWAYATHPTYRHFATRPRAKEQLDTLIREAFVASLHSEEGRVVRFQALFTWRDPQVTARFDIPLDYSSGQLVKLAPTIGIGFQWIVVCPDQSDQESLRIVGLCDPELSPLSKNETRSVGGGLLSHQPDLRGLTLSVFAPGHVRVGTDDLSYFELRHCSIRFPFSVSGIKWVSMWYQDAAKHIECSEPPPESWRKASAGALIRRTWGRILAKVCNAHHGGTLLVVPENAEVLGYVRFKYAMQSDQLKAAITKRARYEPDLSNPLARRALPGADVDDAHFSDKDLARVVDLVASLAAVDGAVVFREELTLLGFGAEILDQEAVQDDETVEYGRHPHGTPPNRSLNAFGMRHRSAFRFCQAIEGSLAFVVSQDGDLRVFANVQGEVRLFDGACPEDWMHPTLTVSETSKSGAAHGDDRSTT